MANTVGWRERLVVVERVVLVSVVRVAVERRCLRVGELGSLRGDSGGSTNVGP
jgi:hypothetical protein